MNKRYFLSAAVLFGALPFGLTAQETPAESPNTKIVIIEEKVDKWGNKTVTRTEKEGNFTDEEIERMIAGESASTASANQGYLGVMIENAEGGVRITEVLDDSPAATAGLKAGDKITAVGETPMTDMESLVAAVSSRAPGDEVTIRFLREDASQSVNVTLAKRNEPSGLFRWDEHVEHLPHRDMMRKSHEGRLNEREEFMHKQEREMGRHRDMMRHHEKAMEEQAAEMAKRNERKPRLGVYLDEVEAGPGVRVTRVTKGSVAEQAGVQKGDIIVSFNKLKVNSSEDLIEAVQNAPADKKVTIELIRGGKKIREKVVLTQA